MSIALKNRWYVGDDEITLFEIYELFVFANVQRMLNYCFIDMII